MRRFSRSGFALLSTAFALLLTTLVAPAPAAAIDLGAGAEVAARYKVRFAAENGSRVSGNGQIVVRAGVGVDLGDGLNADLAVEADASFQLKGLKPNTRYSVVIVGDSAAGVSLTNVCSFETSGGGRSGLAQGGCATTVAGLATVDAVSMHEGGPEGQLVARARVSGSIGIELGLGLGL
ncbi:MAG: hypothetical protein M3464_00115 [Chloroflexota bacterium]|nr:hypothetical protein [Chloroflexota bacterium]